MNFKDKILDCPITVGRAFGYQKPEGVSLSALIIVLAGWTLAILAAWHFLREK
jgi:hypothetical protein